MKQGRSSTAQSLPVDSITREDARSHSGNSDPQAPSDTTILHPAPPERLHNVEYVRFRNNRIARAATVRIPTEAAQRTDQPEAKRQRAQAMTQQVLKEKLGSRSLPQAIHTLLLEHWLQVMLTAYQQNDGGQRWYESIGTIDELIWCLQPHTATRDRQRWVRVVPQVLKQIRQGLEETASPRATLDRQIMELKRELSRTFRQQSISAADLELAPAETGTPSHFPARMKTAVERLEEQEQTARRACQARISSLSPGDRLAFIRADGKVSHYRLHSRSNDRDLYLFCGRMGLRTLTLTEKELVHQMLRGRLHILEQRRPKNTPAVGTSETGSYVTQALA